MSILRLSSRTAICYEVGWRYIDLIKISGMSCAGFCSHLSTEYKINSSSEFVDPGTFFKWFLAWSSNMKQEFRMKCPGCKNGKIEYIAMDGTKIGISNDHIIF